MRRFFKILIPTLAVLLAIGALNLDAANHGPTFSTSLQEIQATAGITSLPTNLQPRKVQVVTTKPSASPLYTPVWAPADRPNYGMEDGAGFAKAASIPYGHHEYCKRRPADCNIRSTFVERVSMNERRWQELLRANRINQEFVQANDKDIYPTVTKINGQTEYWDIPVKQTDGRYYGDCEDLVLAKRWHLMELGWPASSLLITEVRQTGVDLDDDGKDDGHAVLTVLTNKGDLVLDNLTDEIKHWQSVEYEFVKRVNPHHSGEWLYLWDPRFELAD